VSRALLFAALALLSAGGPSAARAESPRWGTFELRLDGYRPDVDSEFAGSATPYADIFGTDRGWMPKALVSYTVFDRFVQLDVGAGTGWFRAKGSALDKDATTGALLPTSSNRDSTVFSIIPTSLALTLRVDGAAQRWRIPVEVFGRATLERYNWLVFDGANSVTKKGATNGWSLSGGVGLLLDFIDPMLGRELDEDTGINETWLFFEIEKSVVDDFGSATSWVLSDEQLTLGGGLRLVF
jgi:hypothetical protein